MEALTEVQQVEYDKLHKELVAQGGPTIGHLKAAGHKDLAGVTRLIELGWVNPDSVVPETEEKPEEKPEPVAKGTQQLMDEGDRARRKGVDALNEKIAANQKKAVGELVDTPLTAEEQAFVAETAAKMNCGRPVEAPSAAEILRYSKLVGRVDVVAEE